MHLRAIIATVCIGVPACCAQSGTDRANVLYHKYQDRIIQVRVIELKSGKKSALGSGFAIGPAGHFATNYHVVSETVTEPKRYRLEYVAAGGAVGRLRILGLDVIHDLAVIAADSARFPYFRYNDTVPGKGTRIFAVGNPLDLGMTIVEGTYNGPVENSLYERILFSGSLNPGMSGGPALDKNGSVIGMNVATAGDEISFLVPVKFLRVLTDSVLRPGYRPPDDFHGLIERQLYDNQKEYLTHLISQEWKLDTLGRALVPREMSSVLRCWGESQQDSDFVYGLTVSSCENRDFIYLSSGMATGKIEYQYRWYEGRNIGPTRLYQVMETQFGSLGRPNYGEREEMADPHCVTDFVTLAGQPWKAVMCVWNYKKYPRLNDVTVKAALAGRQREGLIVDVQLAGVSREMALAFVRKFLGTIRWLH